MLDFKYIFKILIPYKSKSIISPKYLHSNGWN